MDNANKFSEQESFRLITEMITQAKGGYYHDSGISPILWGTVVSVCGFMTFITYYFEWGIGFDWWLLTLAALIPQVLITRNEKRQKMVKTQVGRALDMVWLLYGISIFAVIFYMHTAPASAMRVLSESGIGLLQKNLETGEIKPFALQMPPSPGSLLLLMFGFPTLVTGYVLRCRPMVYGAIATYLFFIISNFTPALVDHLLMGFAGLVNWLIPGVILRKKYLASRK